MSTRNAHPTTEPTFDTSERKPTTAVDRSPTERAPATFAHRNTKRLQNLIDEFNAAFVDPRRN